MKMQMNANYLNQEMKIGMRDPNKTYFMTLFMQGTDTIQLNAPEQIFRNLEEIPPMTECILYVDYNSQYKSLRLLDVQPVTNNRK